MLDNPKWENYRSHMPYLQMAVAGGIGTHPEMLPVFPDRATAIKAVTVQDLLQQLFQREQSDWIDGENKWPEVLLWIHRGEYHRCWVFGTPDEDGWRQLHIATVADVVVIARGRYMRAEDYAARSHTS